MPRTTIALAAASVGLTLIALPAAATRSVRYEPPGPMVRFVDYVGIRDGVTTCGADGRIDPAFARRFQADLNRVTAALPERHITIYLLGCDEYGVPGAIVFADIPSKLATPGTPCSDYILAILSLPYVASVRGNGGEPDLQSDSGTKPATPVSSAVLPTSWGRLKAIYR